MTYSVGPWLKSNDIVDNYNYKVKGYPGPQTNDVTVAVNGFFANTARGIYLASSVGTSIFLATRNTRRYIAGDDADVFVYDQVRGSDGGVLTVGDVEALLVAECSYSHGAEDLGSGSYNDDGEPITTGVGPGTDKAFGAWEGVLAVRVGHAGLLRGATNSISGPGVPATYLGRNVAGVQIYDGAELLGQAGGTAGAGHGAVIARPAGVTNWFFDETYISTQRNAATGSVKVNYIAKAEIGTDSMNEGYRAALLPPEWSFGLALSSFSGTPPGVLIPTYKPDFWANAFYLHHLDFHWDIPSVAAHGYLTLSGATSVRGGNAIAYYEDSVTLNIPSGMIDSNGYARVAFMPKWRNNPYPLTGRPSLHVGSVDVQQSSLLNSYYRYVLGAPGQAPPAPSLAGAPVSPNADGTTSNNGSRNFLESNKPPIHGI